MIIYLIITIFVCLVAHEPPHKHGVYLALITVIKYSTLGNATYFFALLVQLYNSFDLSFELTQIHLRTQILILLSMYIMYLVYITKAEHLAALQIELSPLYTWY